MAHFVGLDVSVQETAVCVVDEAGKVVFEQKVATAPLILAQAVGWAVGRARRNTLSQGVIARETDAA
ncbi:Transposase IS116/IS110/IS902 family protein [Bosea sp. LC85]|nr:Transposase IS116/IS110/IS902 family protein [Bosea sp. LC85]